MTAQGATAKPPRVAVLMSTYNGERYLREQLDSIRDQRRVEELLEDRSQVQ